MPAKEPLTLLERQVALPARRRLWFFAFCCISAWAIGAAFVVGHSLRDAHHHHHRVVTLSDTGDDASNCPSTIMNAALTSEEWQAFLTAPMLAGSARIVPTFASGTPTGLKMYAITPTSLWARVGLENGDTLQKLQGQPLLSMRHVLTVYEQLQRESFRDVHVDLLRDGCPATLDVTVADLVDDVTVPHQD